MKLGLKTLIFYTPLFLLFACGDDDFGDFDFVGTYSGTISCEGPLSSENGNNITITVSSSGDNYLVDLGDNVVFNANRDGDKLVIPDQTLNEGGSVDVIFLEGVMEIVGDNEVAFSFTHDVDNEGLSTCSFNMTK